MIKFLIPFFILSLCLKADLLNEKIENLIGQSEYNKHKNLINVLFKNQDLYQTGEELDYVSIIENLERNGLLKLKFNQPKEILIQFKINSNPVKSIKILKDILKSLGYYYYFTKKTSYDGNEKLTWTIKLKTEAAIDPLVLSKELLKQSCKVSQISREEDKWIYEIDTKYATLNDAMYITSNERVILRKPLKPYFIKIDENMSQIYIVSRILNKWFPNVVFYDKHLNILKVTNKNNIHRNLRISIPENTKYIKISDLYTLINIKRGLSVVIKE